MDENRYFDWLCMRAGVDNGETGFSSLCWILFDTPFLPVLEMDENRCEDGLHYREEYCELKGFGWREVDSLNDILGGCNLLELILSMAERMSYEMADSVYDAGPGKWFEELLGNLGLDIYSNFCLKENPDGYYEVRDILEKLNLRKYWRDGEGGLFPLRDGFGDARDMELLTQMNYYIAQKYDIL